MKSLQYQKDSSSQGNIIEEQGRYVEIAKEFRFEAAHLLPKVAIDHKCRRLHGHSFRFEVCLGGNISSETGWIRDFADIQKVVEPIIFQHLDHYYLNDVFGLENPTSENLAVWLWEQVKGDLPELKQITVFETCTSRCVYRGDK